MSTEIRHEPERSRYVLEVDGEEAGEANYLERGQVVAIHHTFTDPARRGQGLGSTMVTGVLDDLRARGKKVMPACPFVATYLESHPEYADLLA